MIYKELKLRFCIVPAGAVIGSSYSSYLCLAFGRWICELLFHNKFGITLSMNREMSMQKGFDEIENKLKGIKGDFQPIRMQRIGERDTLMIISEHIVPETGNKMKVFHMIFQLNDKERKEAAASARKR